VKEPSGTKPKSTGNMAGPKANLHMTVLRKSQKLLPHIKLQLSSMWPISLRNELIVAPLTINLFAATLLWLLGGLWYDA